MKKVLCTTTFLATAMISLSATAQDEAPLVSNYGFTNLTYGYGQPDQQGTMMHREELLVDGVIHIMWVQKGAPMDWYRYGEVWYRRSEDLGKTWSEPICVTDKAYDGVQEGDKMMSVVDGTVHIVARSQDCHLWYYRSKADGTFDGKDLTPGEHNIDAFRSFAVGNQVAIAYYEYSGSDTYYLYSADGENFTGDRIVADSTPYANQCFLKDFLFDGKRMALLYCNGEKVDIYVSDDFGHNWAMTQLSPTFKDEEGRDYCKGGSLYWWRNGCDASHYVPQLAIDDEKIYTLFYTAIPDGAGQPSEKNYVVLARSLDGGKTWLPLTTITDDFLDGNGNLVVRGDNAYISFDNNDVQKRGVYHSHDGGATFELQNGKGNIFANHSELYVDDNDPTGQTVYLLFKDYGYVKTTDGFRTICEMNCNADYFTSDRYTHLLVDREGRRHWFIEHQDLNNFYVRYINYRREGDDPQASKEDYALHLKPSNDWNDMNYVTIHSADDLVTEREMTIEYWVFTGEKTDKKIARVWSGSDSGYEGWSSKIWHDEIYRMSGVEVKLQNYDDEAAYLISDRVDINSWCHIAFTYSASAGEARLYINGKLADTKPMEGNLRLGRLPIVLGGDSPDNDIILDDFRIWNRPLSDDEIANNYAAKSTGKSFAGSPGLVANYTFDQTLRETEDNHHAISVRTIGFDGVNITGIQTPMVDAKTSNSKSFDLLGREAASDTKGVIVKDGQKRLNY